MGLGVDAGMVRAHQHAAGARRLIPATSTRRSWRPLWWSAQGAASNDTISGTSPDREALGRSRRGVNTNIHLAADRRWRPISRVTTAGECHDSLAFDAVMAHIRIPRRAAVDPEPDPAGCWLTRSIPTG